MSLTGILCAPFVFLGFILGVIALIRGRGSRGWALTAVVVPLVWVPLATLVSWPMYWAQQKRQKQSECRVYLKQAFTAISADRADHDAYSTDWQKIGFAPEGHLRYAYFFSPEVVMTRPFEKHPLPPVETLKAGMPKALLEDLGPHGDCAKECWMTVACAGDIFEDGEIDVWSISTRDRPLAQAGVLLHHEH